MGWRGVCGWVTGMRDVMRYDDNASCLICIS